MASSKARQLVSSDEAVQTTHQHTQHCSDCPWARTALNGWLGGVDVGEWLHRAHTDTYVECHTLTGAQCAGLAIYRRNTCKRVEQPLLTLPADHVACFSNRMEFAAHHEAPPRAKPL